MTRFKSRTGLVLAARLACAGAALVILIGGEAAAAGEPVKLEAGGILDITCETQATQVAPEARVSSGSLKLRLLRHAAPVVGLSPSDQPAAGTWTASLSGTPHAASIAQRHAESCKSGCPLHIGGDGKAFELWVPRRVSLDQAAPGEMLTIAVIDATSLKLKASTFLDRQIASLEQGDCKAAP